MTEAGPNEQDTPQLPGLRAKLLDGLLRNAPFDGWSEAALAAAARDAGVSPELAEVAFPGGLAEAAQALNAEFDRRMVEAIAAEDLAELKLREKVTLALRARFELAGPHREALRTLAVFLANPVRADLAAKLTWGTVDAMWRAVGDRSTDFAYYTKRATLAGVYGATLMVWLQDQSEDFSETYGFLDRRIADVMAFEKTKAKVRDAGRRLLDPLGLFRRRAS